MLANLYYSFAGECIKLKRSLAFWLVIVGATFTPGVITLVRLIHYETLQKVYASPGFWMSLWRSSWESMAVFLLPMCVILLSSLVNQVEYRNNTWKQLHAMPIQYATIFISKLAIVILLVTSFLLAFNLSILLSAIVPYLVVSGVPFPSGDLDLAFFIREDLKYLIDSLPIIGLQYLISLNHKNFMVSIGVGFILWVASLASLTWQYGFVMPYIYGIYNYLQGGVMNKAAFPAFNFHLLALGYFVAFTVGGYFIYMVRSYKG